MWWVMGGRKGGGTSLFFFYSFPVSRGLFVCLYGYDTERAGCVAVKL